MLGKFLDLFDNPTDVDYHWPIEFLMNVLKNVHSEEPYKAKGLKIIQSENMLDLPEHDCDLTSISDEEYTQIIDSSEESYVVLYIRIIHHEGDEIVMPSVYLPPLKYGFHVK